MLMKELLVYAEGNLSSLLLNWRDTNHLMKVLPEFAVMDEFVHNPKFHPEGCTEDGYGTALDHIIESVRIADALNYSPEEKICVLFHDLGKCRTAANYTVDRPYHNFYSHENVGLKVLDCISERMEIDEPLKKRIGYCIRYHMHLYKVKEMRLFKVQNLVRHPLWELLKKVCWCDDASRGLEFRSESFHENVRYAEGFIHCN